MRSHDTVGEGDLRLLLDLFRQAHDRTSAAGDAASASSQFRPQTSRSYTTRRGRHRRPAQATYAVG